MKINSAEDRSTKGIRDVLEGGECREAKKKEKHKTDKGIPIPPTRKPNKH